MIKYTVFGAVALCVSACAPQLAFQGSLPGQGDEALPVERAFPDSTADFYGITTVELPDGGLYSVEFEAIEGLAIAGGDMVLGSAEQFANQRSATVERYQLWPSCTIPYVLDDNLTGVAKEQFLAAAAHWNKQTGMHFVEAPGAPDRVVIQDSSGCSAAIGRSGEVQYMNLSPMCETGGVVHEIGHLVGLFHEQSRTDADQYVEVHWNNVPPAYRHNFKSFVQQGRAGRNLGAYDYSSIMHYPSFAFSTGICNPGDVSGCTLTHVDGSFLKQQQRDHLSEGDLAAVKAMYGDCDVAPKQFPVGDDHSDSIAMATRVGVDSAGSDVSGVLTSGDVDMFRLVIKETGFFTVATSGEIDTVGNLYDASGADLGEDDESAGNGNFSLTYFAQAGEVYYIGVAGYGSDVQGNYTLHAGIDASQGPVVIDVPGAIEVRLVGYNGTDEASFSGYINSGEQTTYRVSIEAAGEVSFSVGTNGDTDTFGVLRDSSGRVLIENDDGPILGSNFDINTTLEPGVYFVDVRGYSLNTTGSYELFFGVGFGW